MPVQVAVLDDYQEVAASSPRGSTLEPEAEVTFFHDHLLVDGVVRDLLDGFEVVVAMRERTPFTAERLASLTDLKLLVTTGMGNAAIDMDAAREHGIMVCGTAALPSPTAELAWGLIIALPAQHRRGGPAPARGRLAAHDRARARRPHARDPRARQPRPADGADRPRVRDGGDRLEREPHRRGGRRGGRDRRRARRAVRARRRAHDPHAAERPHARAGRRARARADEAHGAAGQHLARADRRRGRAARGPARGHDRRRRARRLRQGAAAEGPPSCARRRARCSRRTSAT